MIYLVRHGQTAWNLQKRKQGRKDSPLTLKGIKQAHMISELLKDRVDNFTIVISPQWRCQQFASIICELLQIPFSDCIVEENLREHCFGLWEGKTEEEIENDFPGFLKKRYSKWWDYIVPMGESYELLSNRTLKVLNKYTSQNVVFISHEMVSKTIRGHWLDMKKEDILKLNHPQDTVYCLVNDRIETIRA